MDNLECIAVCLPLPLGGRTSIRSTAFVIQKLRNRPAHADGAECDPFRCSSSGRGSAALELLNRGRNLTVPALSLVRIYRSAYKKRENRGSRKSGA